MKKPLFDIVERSVLKEGNSFWAAQLQLTPLRCHIARNFEKSKLGKFMEWTIEKSAKAVN